ncbi:hypothetical protein J2X36_003073 [Methylobacterium sp. BE186]|uniref:hypothetical protein n=1 Tax=Methylobacterium sp. BE186 TaxID=2817715 RepID=UPI00285B975A|nr:hypothetical protein [Methylobacterium sp. BE186]MDR7038314.1 hypothetical protein [Methylobacterium sp. BE186]
MRRYVIPIALVLAATGTCAAEMVEAPVPSRAPALVSKLVGYAITLEKCKAVKPGRNAQAPWLALRAAYGSAQERWEQDQARLKALVRTEINRQRLTMPEPADGWCEEARRAYGRRGTVYPDAISIIDGSSSSASLGAEASFTADTLEIYQH